VRALGLVVVYLIGAIPVGFLVARAAGGIDIRGKGSGTIGATNVLRTLGPVPAVLTLLGDVAKGYVAVRAAEVIGPEPVWGALGALLAIVGNCWPVFLGFKGGKGVATTAGVVFALIPFAALVMCVVWIATFQASRYVSVASIAAAITLPVTVGALLYFEQLNKPVLLYFSICLVAVVIVRHRSNVSRLLHGTEPRFQRK